MLILAEPDFPGGIIVARGAQDDQLDTLVIVLDLRPHVKVLRVLNCQFMQAEGVPDLGQLIFPRLEQPRHTKPPCPHRAAASCSGTGPSSRLRPSW